jgi:hypothetical protein
MSYWRQMAARHWPPGLVVGLWSNSQPWWHRLLWKLGMTADDQPGPWRSVDMAPPGWQDEGLAELRRADDEVVRGYLVALSNGRMEGGQPYWSLRVAGGRTASLHDFEEWRRV